MPSPEEGPLLVYDGDCAFCVHWVRRWAALTGPAVRYAPYQQVADRLPNVAPEAFRRAVQYVDRSGRVVAGAEASFRVLAHARWHGIWLWLYRHVPGFAASCEGLYALIARHRSAAFRVTLLLWGRSPVPPRYERTVRVLVGGLALVHLVAFASLAPQIPGLVGPDGLLPLGPYLEAAARRYGAARFALFPTVFWLGSGSAALQAACWGGALVSVGVLLGRARRVGLALLAALDLSIFYAGQAFTSFQWDLLLIESTFIALVLLRRPSLFVWVVRWLLFRFMLMAGLVKAFGDPVWRSLGALRHHFESQPLPTPLAWHVARLPDGVLAAGTAAVLAIELLLPFLVPMPRRLRFVAAGGFALLQFAIAATGNYAHYNLLVLVLCTALLDDAALRRLLPERLRRPPAGRALARPPGRAASIGAIGFAAFSLAVGALQVVATIRGPALPDPIARALEAVAPLRIVNAYGPFTVISAERAEIVVEGSRDGARWLEYAFRWKPGDVHRRPGWNAPAQPRLDWQMWFAAMGTQRQHTWFAPLLRGLLLGTPEVVALLGADPFAGAPPRYLRARLYDYRFADSAAHAGGAWWERRPVGLYFPEVELAGDGSRTLVPRQP